MKENAEALDVSAQMRFADGGESLEVDEHTETDLADWGLVEETEQRETRLEVQEASEFGTDDRRLDGDQDAGEQAGLVTDVTDDQRTLAGGSAAGRSLW